MTTKSPQKRRLFSYIVEHDQGFAPNPFWGKCTLAHCKPIHDVPGIRSVAEIGDWVVGLTPKKEGNRVIYFMEVTDKKQSFEEYFKDPKFKKKIPNKNSKNEKVRKGDNIYQPPGSSCGPLRSLHSHKDNSEKENAKRRDLHYDKVLISNNFTYWGRERIPLPKNLTFLIIARGYRNHFSPEQIKTFMKFAKKYQHQGRVGYPTKWDSVTEHRKEC